MTAASCSTTDSSTLTLPLLALDIGGKRIGVAVCDRFGLAARGVACLRRRDIQWPQRVLEIAARFGCRGIVIGLPVHMHGDEGEQAADCRRAAERLRKVTSLPVFFQDERLSSWSAKKRLFALGLKEKKVRERVDQTAAAIILEEFLSAHPELQGG